MSGRITQSQISEIVNKAARETLHKEYERINSNSLEAKMFDLAYKACFDKSIRRKLNRIPFQFLNTSRYARFSFESGETFCLNNYKKEDEQFVPMPSFNSYPSLFVVRGEAAKEIKRWIDEKEALQKKGNEIRSKLREVLNSVSTYGQLKKVWPEGEKFYINYSTNVNPSKSGLPAPILTELNDMLGLTKKAGK